MRNISDATIKTRERDRRVSPYQVEVWGDDLESSGEAAPGPPQRFPSRLPHSPDWMKLAQ